MNPKVSKFSGDVQKIDYTPAGAVACGDVIIIGGIAHFADSDIAAGILDSLCFSGGVWKGNKAAGTWTTGDRIFWNPAANPNVGTAGTGAFQNTPPASGAFVGYAIATPGG